jgi:Tfp pilus assembly protein PilN
MTEGSGANGAAHPFIDRARALGIDVDDPGALAWMEEHLSEFRQQASGQRPLYWILGIGVVVGLAAHVGGFLLRSSVTTEPLEVMADLLYSLGFALWTGVVVVVFVQIWPEAKRRQLERWLDAYDAALREKARAGGGQASGDDGAPTAR